MSENESKLHPTIYYVHLGQKASLVFEGVPAYREKMVPEWVAKARARGKTSVEVFGRYCRLGRYDVQTGGSHVE